MIFSLRELSTEDETPRAPASSFHSLHPEKRIRLEGLKAFVRGVSSVGTDIYLDWNGKTEEDKEKQQTGFSIDAGVAGYLRASIGMVRENTFLRALFPEKYWDNKTGKPIRYKFTEEKYKTLVRAGIVYLVSALAGKEVETSVTRKQAEIGNKIVRAIRNLGIGEVVKSDNLDFRYAIMWINSVCCFFELGMEKEKKSFEPRVYISW